MHLVLAAATAAALTLTACATGGTTLPTQAPATSASETALPSSTSAGGRGELLLHRQEGRQALEGQVVVQADGKMMCDPDPRRQLKAVNLQVNGTIEFGRTKIATRTENGSFKIIPVDGRYPGATILIVNDTSPVVLPHNLGSAYTPENRPVLVLDPKEFGGSVKAAAFCSSEQ